MIGTDFKTDVEIIFCNEKSGLFRMHSRIRTGVDWRRQAWWTQSKPPPQAAASGSKDAQSRHRRCETAAHTAVKANRKAEDSGSGAELRPGARG